MNDYISILKNDLSILIDRLIETKIILNSFNKENISIDFQSKVKQGDVSTNLYIILKKNVVDKKNNLDKILKNNISNFPYIKNIEISKVGFINIFFNKDFLFKKLNQILISRNTYGNNNLGQRKKINVEFVSANPTGPVHIAHMRGAVLGDVLASILESTGYVVTREYYINNVGSQIKTLGRSLFKRYTQIFGESIKISPNEYPGDYLINLAKKIKNIDSDKWLNQPELKRQKYFEAFAIQEIIKSIKKDLELIHIKFNKFTYESKIVESNIIEKVFSLLKNKDLLYEGILEKPKGEDLENWKSRKQLLFRSSKFADDKDRAFKKETGEWTYFANDAAYHYDKYSRNFQKLINIWGADHIGYIRRMKSIVEVISNQTNYLEVFICQIVRIKKNGKILKMSKREGNLITISEIMNQVGKDPLRYFMISSKAESPMDFDMDKVIEKNKDNPVFYCQYAYARASSVINKSKTFVEFNNFENNLKQINYSYFSKYEWEIILKLLSWPYLLNQVSISKQPHKITNYLEDLCSNFHSFWNRGKDDLGLRMLDIDNKEKTIAKLFWIETFRIVLKRAFTLIGIDAPEQM